MAASGSYKLELEPPKQRVFVTQIHEREDEAGVVIDDSVKNYPVVKESASRLLEAGVSTLQRTLLLKREVEVEQVNEELRNKRAWFRDTMEATVAKQSDVEKKQQKMKDRVTKFEKFINDNEAKRRRAIQRYQQEVRIREQKSIEFSSLEQELEEYKKRHFRLKNKLKKYKKYEDYLSRVVEILPDNYLEVQDTMLNSLMLRHRTLSETKEKLEENLESLDDELKQLRKEYDQLKQEHGRQKISINSRLSQMQKTQEKKSDKNQRLDQTYSNNKIDMRSQCTVHGQILMAINNIAEKCRRGIEKNYENKTYEEKLDIIKDFIATQVDVVKIVSKDVG